jgi:esterase
MYTYMLLYYRQAGQGKPLIILHGLFGSSDNWMTLTKTYSQHYSVYLLDQRNHGRSPWNEEWNYQAMAEDLHEFIQTHQLWQPALIGHSMGGKTAMFYAQQYENLSALVVVDIAPRQYHMEYDDYLTGMMAMPLADLNNRKDAEDFLSHHVSDPDVLQFLLKNLYRNEKGQFAWRHNLEIIARHIQNVGQALPADKPVRKPALFIRGEKSNYVRDKDWPETQQLFPLATLETIADASHWVQAEKPAEFLQLSLSFLEQNT